MTHEKVKVLYIGGYSRSGSTLLLRFLGQMQNFIAVGEVWDIWQRSFTDNQLCGCGQPFCQCSFWQAVVEEAFGGFEHVDAQAMQALRRSVQSNRHLPFLALPALQPTPYRERLKAYTEVLGKLYQGIHKVSGGKVIVDSSKVPPYAYLLSQVANVDLYVVHLVRDSRATAYSWQRKKLRPEIHWKTAYMEQYSPVRSAMEWNVMNGLLDSLRHSSATFMRIRYEELVQEPRKVILRLLAGLGQEQPEADFLNGDHIVRLGVDHTVSGNPNRFEQGPITIRPDVEWQEKMSRSQKGLVTALTWPLLLSYGYFNADPSSTNHTASESIGNKILPRAGPSTQSAPLRVLMVTARFLPHIGGTEIHTFEVARRLAAAGNDVTVLTTNPGKSQTIVEQSEGIKIIRVPAWPGRNDYYFAPAMFRIIREGRWDIIHCQGYHTLVAPIAILAAWQVKIPYIVTFHSGGHSSWWRNAIRPLQRALLRPLLAQASGLVGVSKWEADFFRERLHLPDTRFAVIPNGSYLPKKVEAISSPQSDETLIVSIGRLERYKGHHHVIAALPTVLKQQPGVRLRIVGSGPYEAVLRQQANDLGVADRVEIKAMSASEREGMAALLLGSALVILLSNYESQSISVMEALALGRPVLVADAAALHELAAGGLARATPLGSTPEAVAAAILDQLHQPLIPPNSELPSWDACARDVLALYHNTLNNQVACAY